MAIIKGSESLIKGISGKIGPVVGTVDAENRTVLRAMPTTGRQGRQEGNIIPQERAKIVGEYMTRNNFSFEQFFEKSRPATNGSSEFSKRNLIKTGPFEVPDEPNYEKLFISYGGYSKINTDEHIYTYASGILDLEVQFLFIPEGTEAIIYIGVIDKWNKIISYYAGDSVNSASSNRNVAFSFAVNAIVPFTHFGVFFIDKVTRQPSISKMFALA